jgi:cytoskeletal protein CcmA (bactofilin family)
LFSRFKGERGSKTPGPEPEVKLDGTATPDSSENVSTLGRGMLVTGNIVCADSVQISGRLVGDIHAAHVMICEGAHVQGNILAVEAVIDGNFRGTIHANTVKLQSTAVVEGEILKQSLIVEHNAQFEGVSRRLDRPVEAPSQDQVNGNGSRKNTMADVVPISGVLA